MNTVYSEGITALQGKYPLTIHKCKSQSLSTSRQSLSLLNFFRGFFAFVLSMLKDKQ